MQKKLEKALLQFLSQTIKKLKGTLISIIRQSRMPREEFEID